ncbi:hypothetical protein U9M48_014072 [Paspalum notatum var. saurae]|uniref:Uncharacterized protein n=1 Tax=Paspalum notatum var. saurae TaxID=547442 RepID=A0AAQ3T0V0_PASNO
MAIGMVACTHIYTDTITASVAHDRSQVLWRGHGGRKLWQRHLALQHAHRQPDGRPQVAVRMGARQADDHHTLHFAVVEVAAHPLVGGIHNDSSPIQAPDPLHEAHPALEDDAEAVDVRLRPRAAGEEALGVHVAHGAREVGGVGAAAVVEEPREAEVAQLGAEPNPSTILNLQQGTRHPLNEDGWVVEVGVKAAIGHQFVHQQQLPALVAPPYELNKVPVPQPAYDLNLRGVLFPALNRTP